MARLFRIPLSTVPRLGGGYFQPSTATTYVAVVYSSVRVATTLSTSLLLLIKPSELPWKLTLGNLPFALAYDYDMPLLIPSFKFLFRDSGYPVQFHFISCSCLHASCTCTMLLLCYYDWFPSLASMSREFPQDGMPIHFSKPIFFQFICIRRGCELWWCLPLHYWISWSLW